MPEVRLDSKGTLISHLEVLPGRVAPELVKLVAQ